MFTNDQIQQGNGQMLRQFFNINLEEQMEAQFIKIIQNYQVDCLCHTCQKLIKYPTLRNLLIHSIECLNIQTLEAEEEKLLKLDQVELIDVPYMQSLTLPTQIEKKILSSLQELRAIVTQKDQVEDAEIEYKPATQTMFQTPKFIPEEQLSEEIEDDQALDIRNEWLETLEQQIKSRLPFSGDHQKRFIDFARSGRCSGKRSESFHNVLKNVERNALVEYYRFIYRQMIFVL